jgi:hypothetical protein
MNELRGQVPTRRIELSSTDQDGGGVSIAGVADFGSSYAGNNTHDQTYVELGDTVGHSRGSHFLKAGVNVRHVAVAGATTDGIHGIDVFRTLDAFLAGRPDAMRQMSARANVDLCVTRASAFIQDHWTPTPGITVDGGAGSTHQSFPRPSASRIGR